MSVTVTKTAGNRAEITWEPREDDPRGFLARAVEGDQLAYALEALGQDEGPQNPATEADAALQAAMHTTALARLLERRAAVQVVHLRDVHGLSWRRIATALHDDPERQSTVRRQYEAGRRHLGT
ncbi:hypothetical protein [Streptomyces sp. NPDC048659]|uniref:hypothetical protein n=1 Tax=Streptomyces sp. NPDC048659 TaxID=3155489 RepID=UPI0034192032